MRAFDYTDGYVMYNNAGWWILTLGPVVLKKPSSGSLSLAAHWLTDDGLTDKLMTD